MKSCEEKLEAALDLLDRAANCLLDVPIEDENWWKDYFLMNGTHHILTDEGWESGAAREEILKQCKEDGLDPEDVIFDEVNAPETPVTAQ